MNNRSVVIQIRITKEMDQEITRQVKAMKGSLFKINKSEFLRIIIQDALLLNKQVKKEIPR